jgi:sec-independent protein translocase protein TatA
MRLGIWEILIILIVAMLFFGPTRVSGLGTALGKSIRGFKRGLSGEDEPPPPAPGGDAGSKPRPGPPAA